MIARTDGYNYAETKDLDIAAIAKLVRATIKARIAAGSLFAGKYSVTIERYSMGREIRIAYSMIENGAFDLFNGRRLAWDLENPHASYHHAPENARCILSTEARGLEDSLEGILASYNFCESDPGNDYTSRKFSTTVEAESDWRARRRIIETDRIVEARSEARSDRAREVANDTNATPAQVAWLESMGAQ